MSFVCEIMILILSVLTGFFLLGIVIPVSVSIGDVLSDRITSFLIER